MFGGFTDEDSYEPGPTEIITIGKNSFWTDLGITTHYSPYAATVDNEVLMHGRLPYLRNLECSLQL